MLLYEVLGEDVLHVARVKLGVVDAVDAAVLLGVLDGLWHILDADDVACLPGHEVGDGARARVEVVHQFVAREVRKLSRHAIEVVSLFGVGLVEALRSHLEAQLLHRLVDEVGALEGCKVEVADGVVALLVVHVDER